MSSERPISGILDELHQIQSQSAFDGQGIKDLLLRLRETGLQATMPSALPKLIHAKPDCLMCHWGVQIDPYVEGCSFNCQYCWAKAELAPLGLWNNPKARIINLVELWNALHQVFEKNEKHDLSSIFKRKIPIRLGSYSDPLMQMESEYQATSLILDLLNHYQYPYLIVTRSTLVNSESILKRLRVGFGAVQISIPTLNEELIKTLEPSAPSARDRLKLVSQLREENIVVSVRINPLFPTHENGFYSQRKSEAKETNLFQLSMLKEYKKAGVNNILVGFANLPQSTIEVIQKKFHLDWLAGTDKTIKNPLSQFYAPQEIRQYYEAIRKECHALGMGFTICYLGQSESFYWRDRDLLENPADCCNLKGKNQVFESTALDLSVLERLKHEYEMSYLKRLQRALFLKIRSYFYKKIWEN